MAHYIDKDALVAEIERLYEQHTSKEYRDEAALVLEELDDFLDTLEVKEVDLMIHTIIAECCDWLASHTNLSHNEIESCRNLMLTVKEEHIKEMV